MSDRRWLNRGAVYTRERGGAMASRCGSERLRHPPLPSVPAGQRGAAAAQCTIGRRVGSGARGPRLTSGFAKSLRVVSSRGIEPMAGSRGRPHCRKSPQNAIHQAVPAGGRGPVGEQADVGHLVSGL